MNGLCPFNYPTLYSSIILGNAVSPGTVTLSGHDSLENWDVQEAKGTTGASTTLNGKTPGTFKATFYLVADSDDELGNNDFIYWEYFQAVIESTVSGVTPIALPIYHPDLCRNKITEVVKDSISGLVWDSKGGATVDVVFRKYVPARPKPAAAPKSKAASSTAAAKVTREDPNAAAKRELNALVDEAKRP
jgi:hypothetical protein